MAFWFIKHCYQNGSLTSNHILSCLWIKPRFFKANQLLILCACLIRFPYYKFRFIIKYSIVYISQLHEKWAKRNPINQVTESWWDWVLLLSVFCFNWQLIEKISHPIAIAYKSTFHWQIILGCVLKKLIQSKLQRAFRDFQSVTLKNICTGNISL